MEFRDRRGFQSPSARRRKLFPRSSNHNGLSKLHYLAEKKPEVLYFGSSRVEIGLPAKAELFPGKSVYNAGTQASTLGNVIPLMEHVLSGYTPRVIVLGLDFATFTTEPSQVDFDMSLLSASSTEYRIRRFFHDLTRALSPEATMNSLRSIRALLADHPYDETDEPASLLGQASDAEMERLTIVRGKNIEAFQWALRFAYGPSLDENDGSFKKRIDDGLKMLDAFVALACTRQITLRIFYNPRHALAEHGLNRGYWPVLEYWKGELGQMSTKYQQDGCDVRIFDFSGYNSITTESVLGVTATTGLRNYWEASHYKSVVGEMILRRLFSLNDASLPPDFGRELSQATSAEINALVRAEQKAYQGSHAEEIAIAKKWATGGRAQ